MSPATRRPHSLRLLLAAVLAFALAACGTDPIGPAGPRPPVDLSEPWIRSDAADEGFDVDALVAAFEHARTVENLRALVVVRNGRLVAEGYYRDTGPELALDLRSVTKTVTALLVGMAADSGYLTADDPVADWLAGHPLRPEHAGIRVEHLLTMTSGIEWSDAEHFGPWAQSPDWVDYVLALPVVAAPGERFIYNTGTSHLLMAILERAVGRGAVHFAVDRLLAPLGVEGRDFAWWGRGETPNGGAGLALRATDAARIGQLLLQGGRSGDRQLVSADWVDRMTGERFDFGGPVSTVLDDGGYGYQLWTDAAPEAWVAWGYGGQFIWVVPSKELVVVTASYWGGIGYDGSAAQAAANAALIRDRIVPAAR